MQANAYFDEDDSFNIPIDEETEGKPNIVPDPSILVGSSVLIKVWVRILNQNLSISVNTFFLNTYWE